MNIVRLMGQHKQSLTWPKRPEPVLPPQDLARVRVGQGAFLLLVVPARPDARAPARPDAVHVGQTPQQLLLLLFAGDDRQLPLKIGYQGLVKHCSLIFL